MTKNSYLHVNIRFGLTRAIKTIASSASSSLLSYSENTSVLLHSPNVKTDQPLAVVLQMTNLDLGQAPLIYHPHHVITHNQHLVSHLPHIHLHLP